MLTAAAFLLALGAGVSSAEVVPGTVGDDDLRGTSAPDRLLGQAGDDSARGGPGDDTFAGNPRDDSPFGGRGDDLLLDDAGLDLLSGGPGDDVVSVPGFGPGPPGLYEESDTVSCGRGSDTVEAHPSDLVAADCEAVTRVSDPF